MLRKICFVAFVRFRQKNAFVRFRQKNGFCVLVDVHKMAKIRKVLCKQYVSTEKILKSPNILWLFCEL